MKELEMIYGAIEPTGPGWLAGAVKCMALSETDVAFLETLDDTARSWLTKDAQKWFNEVERHYRWGIAHLDDAGEQVAALSKRIAEAYERYKESAERDEPFLNRLVILKVCEVEAMEKERRGIRGRTLHKADRGEPRAGAITDEAIVRARAVPFEKLIGCDDGDRIRCPLHNGDGTRTMLVRGGWGHCFSCGDWIDSIKFLTVIEGLTFRQAVDRLQTV